MGNTNEENTSNDNSSKPHYDREYSTETTKRAYCNQKRRQIDDNSPISRTDGRKFKSDELSSRYRKQINKERKCESGMLKDDTYFGRKNQMSDYGNRDQKRYCEMDRSEVQERKISSRIKREAEYN